MCLFMRGDTWIHKKYQNVKLGVFSSAYYSLRHFSYLRGRIQTHEIKTVMFFATTVVTTVTQHNQKRGSI